MMLTDGLMISVRGSLRSSLLTEQISFLVSGMESVSAEPRFRIRGGKRNTEHRPSWRLAIKPLDSLLSPSFSRSDSVSHKDPMHTTIHNNLQCSVFFFFTIRTHDSGCGPLVSPHAPSSGLPNVQTDFCFLGFFFAICKATFFVLRNSQK